MRRKYTYIATIWRYEWPHSHNRQATEYNIGSGTRGRYRRMAPHNG